MRSSVPLIETYAVDANRRSRAAGFVWRDTESCREYFQKRVANRLRAADATEFLRDYLQRMPDTGFSLTHLRIEAAQSRMLRDWEIGEAFAECVLEDWHGCLFPWPTSRDRREEEGCLTGPDLPGYCLCPAKPARFAFGEIKSSSQKTSPPAVIFGVDKKAGNDTLVGQLRRLLTEHTRRQTLIAWLGFRDTSDAEAGARFDRALRNYRDTGDCLIIGCLVSGNRTESEVDLEDACRALDDNVAERELWLFAFYLPFEKADWPSLVAAKGGRG
jgi:hypothetical protein